MAQKHQKMLDKVVSEHNQMSGELTRHVERGIKIKTRLVVADEAGQTLASKLHDAKKQSDEYELQVAQMEEVLTKVKADVFELEWLLNEQKQRAELAENGVEVLCEQGSNINA